MTLVFWKTTFECITAFLLRIDHVEDPYQSRPSYRSSVDLPHCGPKDAVLVSCTGDIVHWPQAQIEPTYLAYGTSTVLTIESCTYIIRSKC